MPSQTSPDPAATPLRPAGELPNIPKASPSAMEALPGLYGNSAANGRLSASPRPGARKIAWTADLGAGFHATHLLATPSRIVAVSATSWVLLDASGKVLARNNYFVGDVSIDPGTSTVVARLPNGAIGAWNLDDGKPVFVLPAVFGEEMVRILIRRVDSRIIIVGCERQVDPHAVQQPNLTVAEVQEIGRKPTVNDVKFVLSAQRLRTILRDSSTAAAAFDGRTLMLATPDQVTIADDQLKVKAVLSAKFEPVALSLDEAGRAYMICRTGESTQLWAIDGDKLLLSREVPAGVADLAAPPAVGYDHAIYLRSAAGIVALSVAGKPLWEFSGATAGLAVAPDGQVIAAAGSRLLWLDAAGKAETLCECGQRLATAPLLMQDDTLLAASADKLYAMKLP